MAAQIVNGSVSTSTVAMMHHYDLVELEKSVQVCNVRQNGSDATRHVSDAKDLIWLEAEDFIGIAATVKTSHYFQLASRL